jgi:Spy/CpxP family protein refolding chaperone
MKPMFQTAGIAMALLTALPVAAQTAAPAAPPAPAMGGMHAGPNPGAGKRAMRLQMFNSLSPAGQAVMREAMKAGDPKADRAAMKAARDQILVVLDADKLDVAALKRAMDNERNTAEAMHNRRQAALLGAYQKLSVADRKALVAEARAMRDRMDAHMAKMGGQAMMMQGGMDDMPPPPPPPAR